MSTTPDYAGLIAALTSYQQADEDGVMVVVSRQACDEAASALRTLLERNKELERELEMWREVKHSSHWKVRAEAAEAKLAEAMKVIEPFATAADNFDGFKISDPREWFAYGGSSNAAGNDRSGSISVADIRAARKFLKENGNGE